MTVDVPEATASAEHPTSESSPSGSRAYWVVAMTLVLIASAGMTGWIWLRPSFPAEDSADVGFARDMQSHHAQAIEMAFLIRDRTDNPMLRTIALDIITSQQQQIGQMYGWLEMWQLPQTSTSPPMSWMDMDSDHGGAMSRMPTLETDAYMPGMATTAQLHSLEQAQGRRAEVIFLQLMIAHHKGGVTMAQAALQQAKESTVLHLATAVEAAQTAEIEQMRQLLRDLKPTRTS